MIDILQQDIQYLPGVGPNRKKMLSQELGIETFGDLLQYYPYKHVDRSRLYDIGELNGDMPFVQVKGHILSFETFKMSARKERVVALRTGEGPYPQFRDLQDECPQRTGGGSFHRWYREGDGPDMVQWWEICQAEL